MSIISPLPFTLTNGEVADGSQVMADLNQIRNDVNSNAVDINQISSVGNIKSVTSGNLSSNGSSVTIPARSMPILYAVELISGSPVDPGVIILLKKAATTIGSLNSITLSDTAAYIVTGTNNQPAGDPWFSATSFSLNFTSSDWMSSTFKVTIYYVTI